jgi:hypothetical protein
VALTGWRRQQQVVQIVGKHLDGFAIGRFFQLAHQLQFQRQEDLGASTAAHHPAAIYRRRPLSCTPKRWAISNS